MAQLTPKDIRSDIFAWYILLGHAGSAFGMVISGWLVQEMIYGAELGNTGPYRVVFWIYALLGLVKFGMALALSNKCEPEAPKQEYQEVVEMGDTDAEGLLSDSDSAEGEEDDEFRKETQAPPRRNRVPPEVPPRGESKRRSLWPAISKESRSTMVKLCLLFSVDSAASGLATASWMTYFFTQKFHLPEGQLGTLFFASAIIGSAGVLAASSISKRIGLIKTMVFTHLPSAILLALIPMPSQAWLAMMFLLIRASMSSADQAPRQAFIASVVLPSERTAMMGTVNVVKTLSQSIGPVVTGGLAQAGRFWVAFVLAGTMKAAYDLGMLKMFLGYRTREDNAVDGAKENGREGRGQA